VPILVVEDDASMRGFLSTLLTDAGFSVLVAETGQRAIDLLEHGSRPWLMIVDLMLPRVSGADVLRYAHEDSDLRHVPKVVITVATGNRFRQDRRGGCQLPQRAALATIRASSADV
jgi:CheY-like chemotaxis protein